MRNSSVVPVCALTLVLAWPAASAQVPERSLGSPRTAFEHEFTSVSGVRELPDGRLLVLDTRERKLSLLDPRDGSSKAVGREGSGPQEYLRPGSLLTLPGDTTLLADVGNSRFLVLNGAGAIVGILPRFVLEPSAGVTYIPTIRVTDLQGRFYYELPIGLVSNREAGVPLIRHDRRASKSDTVGYLFGPASRPVAAAPSANGVSFGVNAPTPYALRDEWAVAWNGAATIVRAEPYRVDWVATSGARGLGPVQTYTPVRVRDAEKAEWRAQSRAGGGPTITTRDASGNTSTQRLPIPEPDSWPEVKPPFVSGATVAVPTGGAWILRSSPAGAPRQTYDVVDGSGRLTGRVSVPANVRVVAITTRSVIATERDDDDLIRLRVFTPPEP